jgi:hypothetical protein
MRQHARGQRRSPRRRHHRVGTGYLASIARRYELGSGADGRVCGPAQQLLGAVRPAGRNGRLETGHTNRRGQQRRTGGSSEDLTFTALAQTTDAGVDWSQNNVLDAGIADFPGALAGGPAGQLLAVTQAGDVDASSSSGASWSRLTTQHALAATTAGRACGLMAIDAAAWSPGGTPVLGGDCREHGVAGIFMRTAGAWQAAGPSLPAAIATDPVSVIGLNTTGTRTTAVLAAGTGADTGVIAAWSTNGGASWTLSGELRTGAGNLSPSVSFGPDGSAALVLPGKRAGSASRGATIGWQAAAWQELPPLPAYTATIAATASGAPEALSAHGSTLTAWQLPATGSASSWTAVQTVRITIPYGSSS